MHLKRNPPYLAGNNRVTLQMLQVLIALIPAVIAMVFFFGPGVLVNITLALTAALLSEAVILKLRNRPLKPFLSDGSAAVTAVLLAIAIPPLSPWWLTVIGVLFAIVFAKHLYGGLGHNPFNPAMIGYVLLLLSFPVEMTSWLPTHSLADQPAGLMGSLSMIFTGQFNGLTLDSLTGATPLDHLKTELGQGHSPEFVLSQPLYGLVGGIGWEWVNVWLLLGGVWLMYRNVISWHIPLAMLGSLFIFSGITWLIAPQLTAPPLFHLFSGGTMLCAFFIATDPVSGATTQTGRLIFGAGVGLLVYLIRVWGGYPDAVAFAVILMNMLVPLIDYYTQPRVYGEKR